MSTGHRLRRALVACLLLLGALAAPALAYPPAPEGPALETPAATLHAALSCPGGLTHPARPVVLLVHGTGTTGPESWPEGFGKTLPLKGFDWCMVELPDRAMGDVQISSEYVVSAVRELAAGTGRKVDLIGHSQGAIEVRWPVRWWPDVRAEVDDVITLAGANAGVASADTACGVGYCAPAIWQMRTPSLLEAALNQVPAPSGPSYTAIYTNNDELVEPPSSGTFAGASNVLVQDVCPGRPVDHVSILYDAAVSAIAFDALENPGAAVKSRVPAAVCSATTAPGVDPAAASAAATVLGINAGGAIASHPTVTSEPPLKPYAKAAGGSTGPSGPTGPTGSTGSTGPGGAGPRPAARPCVVPKVTGLTLGRARGALARAHCRAGLVVAPRHRRRGQVLVVKSTNPRAGAHRAPGARVGILLVAVRRG